MDPNRRTPVGLRTPASQDLVGNMVLGSRRDALASLRSAVLRKSGPVLLTGEAGVGKTWLWRRLAAELSENWRWIGVDLSPADTPADLYRSVARALGFNGSDAFRGTRTSVAEFLEERAADGEAWGLVVDETQSVSPEVLEEIRILANRLGMSDGFSALVVVGHTVLARRLVTPSYSALAVRLTEHVHLRPLHVDEAARLIAANSRQAPVIDHELVEQLHRDSLGNPRRLLNLLSRLHPPAPAPMPSVPSKPAEIPASLSISPPPPVRREVPEVMRDAPVLGPPKPPLHVEENLIEVGWEPSSELSELDEIEQDVEDIEDVEPYSPTPAPRPSMNVEPSEETIDDRYAALQAWNEWAKNQGRDPNGETRPYATSAGRSLSIGSEGVNDAAPANGSGFWADH